MTHPLLDTMLEQAARPYRSATRLAIACAVVAAITGIALLGLAGWFITGAALAGAPQMVRRRGGAYAHAHNSESRGSRRRRTSAHAHNATRALASLTPNLPAPPPHTASLP